MKRKITISIFHILLIISTTQINGQTVDLLPYCVTNIEQYRNGKQVGTATGFFYFSASQQLHLITNQHVLYEDPNRYGYTLPLDSFKITVHTDTLDLHKIRNINIPLQGNNKLETKMLSDSIDLVGIKISNLMQNKDYYRALSKNLIISDDIKLTIGDKLMIIGYPLGLYDNFNNLPIVRSGTVASLPNIKYENRPFFLVDGILHPGMSGAPAFTTPERFLARKGSAPAYYSEPISFFVGVHSASISKNGQAMILGTIWYAKILEELVSKQ